MSDQKPSLEDILDEYSSENKETKAAGRIDRLNTPFNDLWYYHLKTRSSIDKGISMALKNKKDFNERRFIGG